MEWNPLITLLLLGLFHLSPASTDVPLSTTKGPSTDAELDTTLPPSTKLSSPSSVAPFNGSTQSPSTTTSITTTTTSSSISSNDTSVVPLSTTALNVPSTTMSSTQPHVEVTPRVDSPSSTTPVTTTTPVQSSSYTFSVSHRIHHGKKELEDEADPLPSSPLPIDNINQQFVEEPISIKDDIVQEVVVPSSSKSSLFAGLVFGSILSMALGFLIYKRIDAARRRREYRRMNDYLIDGMYNDI